MAKALLIKADTYRRLGFANLVRAAWYRIRLKSGVFKRLLPVPDNLALGDFYETSLSSAVPPKQCNDPDSTGASDTLFGHIALPLNRTPDWRVSVLNGKAIEPDAMNKHWSELGDFDLTVGDIKGVWEVSRFGWVIPKLKSAITRSDCAEIQSVNDWIRDWSANNKANLGVNWKCAQEVSFRILHLASGALLLGQHKPSPFARQLIRQHLARIWPTMGYAKAQDNNHGTTEAVALMVGGSWLLQHDPNDREAEKYSKAGRAHLQERVQHLVMPDGTFSQYSVTYHRLMLDTLCFAELWRRFTGQREFSHQFYELSRLATTWLFWFVDKHHGDAPNIGTNDGAHVFNYLSLPYRNFKPSVELAAMLFHDKIAYGDIESKSLSQLFGLTVPRSRMRQGTTKKFSDGGFGVVQNDNARCVIRVPRFRFRPAHADMQHLDLWVKGTNLLRDGGSYSYNTEQSWLEYFSGVASHNTIQFDQNEPMPRISRFLFGTWPRYRKFSLTHSKSMGSVLSDFITSNGHSHCREVTLHENYLEVHDTVSGDFQQAVVRWRLPPETLDSWEVHRNGIKNNKFKIEVLTQAPILRLGLAKGYESRYYGQIKAIPVLEVVTTNKSKIKTIIRWA